MGAQLKVNVSRYTGVATLVKVQKCAETQFVNHALDHQGDNRGVAVCYKATLYVYSWRI